MTWRGPYIVREQGSPVANILVSAAGPLSNLAIAALAWHDYRWFAVANLTLGLSNFLPVPGSDGRRIWQELTRGRTRETSSAQLAIDAGSAAESAAEA